MRHPPPPTPSTPVPRLPPELECLIFQLAAHARKWGIPKLMLVARRVHIWTEPILYSTFLAFHPHSRDRHHQGRHHQPPVSQLPRYGKHIRHLVIGSDAQVDEGINYLRHCLNVRELVILSDFWHPDTFKLVGTHMRDLRILSVHLPTFFARTSKEVAALPPLPLPDQNRLGPPFYPPPFPSLTHLEIIDPDLSSSDLSWLVAIPNLTHLALNAVSNSLIEHVLKTCQNLTMLVLLYDYYPSTLISYFHGYHEYQIDLSSPNLHRANFCNGDRGILPESLLRKIVPVNVLRWDQDWRRGSEEFWKFAEDRARQPSEKRFHARVLDEEVREVPV